MFNFRLKLELEKRDLDNPDLKESAITCHIFGWTKYLETDSYKKNDVVSKAMFVKKNEDNAFNLPDSIYKTIYVGKDDIACEHDKDAGWMIYSSCVKPGVPKEKST